MADTSQKLPLHEKLGYSAADAAANFVFMTMVLFQNNYYMQIFGFAGVTAGVVVMIPRLWDAFFDPIMGYLTDRTKTRWGKFRPWILWTTIPWFVVMILAYTKPPFIHSNWALLTYAIITNTLLMTIYSMNNMPYAALGGVMTGDPNERASLNSYRFIAVNIAQFVVGGFTLPLVAKFADMHNGDRAYGWSVTMSIWAVLCLVLFMITFLTTKERILPTASQSNFIDDLKDLMGNNPWWVMFFMTMVHFAYLAFRGSAFYNYYHSYADNEAMYKWCEKFGLVLTDGNKDGWLNWIGYLVKKDMSNAGDVFNSIVNMLDKVVLIAVILSSPFLARKFGKKVIAATGFFLMGLSSAAYYFLSQTNVWGMMALTVISALCYAPTIALIWAMYADVADYSEWKNGRRATGIVFATIGFGLKAGLSLGGLLIGILLEHYTYDAQATVQNAAAVQGIRLCSSIYPAILIIVCGLLIVCYGLGKDKTLQIANDLAERRKTAATKA